MARIILGLALVLHSLGQAAVGMLASEGQPPVGRVVLITVAWTVAVGGFFAAGLGVWGAPLFRGWWRVAIWGATVASFGLFLLAGRLSLLLGPALDLVFVWLSFRWSSIADMPPQKAEPRGLRVMRVVANTFAVLVLAYVGLVVALRPWHHDWGTSRLESEAPLIGDEFAPNRLQSINHSITINAPPERVWPWLVQIGQGRGGFYSYDWLERAFGDDIHNADRILPEHQSLRKGDLIRAVQPDYLGGRLGDSVGWKVVEVIPERALVLENWGAFVLVPEGENKTRLIIRTHYDTGPIWAAPIGLFLFEPVHFIMEQKMLRTIKQHAESNIGEPQKI